MDEQMQSTYYITIRCHPKGSIRELAFKANDWNHAAEQASKYLANDEEVVSVTINWNPGT